ncbi:MAG: sulfite exporter TauE/SafE family protein [Hymenobacteraceae bacterium]|nr:sulfite exporter TauE/SafE family protein [Hymenobacteraceae bacterium]
MLWAGFVFGLLSSFHCVGMCGAIALALPGAATSGERWLVDRLLYHAGRIGTYAVLGAAVGTVGRSLHVLGWQQGLSITSGVLILLLVVVPEAWRVRAAGAVGLARPLAAVQRSLSYWFQQRGSGALLLTGALNGLLPCGMVYLALAGALSAPGVGGAAAYMALFGVGTLPLLLGVGFTGRLVAPAVRFRLRRAVPWAAGALAVLFIVRGLGLGIPYLSPAAGLPVPGQPYQAVVCHEGEKP